MKERVCDLTELGSGCRWLQLESESCRCWWYQCWRFSCGRERDPLSLRSCKWREPLKREAKQSMWICKSIAIIIISSSSSSIMVIVVIIIIAINIIKPKPVSPLSPNLKVECHWSPLNGYWYRTQLCTGWAAQAHEPPSPHLKIECRWSPFKGHWPHSQAGAGWAAQAQGPTFNPPKSRMSLKSFKGLLTSRASGDTMGSPSHWAHFHPTKKSNFADVY